MNARLSRPQHTPRPADRPITGSDVRNDIAACPDFDDRVEPFKQLWWDANDEAALQETALYFGLADVAAEHAEKYNRVLDKAYQAAWEMRQPRSGK